MRVLLIAYYFPPINSGGTARPVKMARYLPTLGCDVTILTHTYEKSSFSEKIIRIKDPSYNKDRHGVRYFIWLGKRLISELINRLGFHHSIYHWWRNKTIKHGKKIIETAKPDIIIASYPPIETFEIGRRLSQTFNIPLVCDFRDGIMFEPIEKPRLEKFPRVKKHYETVEKETVTTASAVITIADPITQYYSKTYPMTPAYTIGKGFDPEDFKNVPVPAEFDPFQFHIVFTGRFGLADGSNRVDFFFDGLRQMLDQNQHLEEKVKVHLVGDFTRADLKLVDDLMTRGVVICHGLVSGPEAIGFQKIADLLLIITLPDRTCSVSTKIFEYICAEKPILALTHETVLADMVEQTQTGWIVHPQKPGDIAELMHRIITDREFYINLEPNQDAIHNYSIIQQLEKLIPILESVVSSPGEKII